MTLLELLSINLAVILGAAFALWLFSVRLRNAGIVDVFWGCGFAFVCWVSLAARQEMTLRPLVLTSLTTLWGLRLTFYLAWRNHGKPEDYRYASMRQRHGNRFPFVSLFTVFVLQGVLIWFISVPLQIGIAQGQGWQNWRAIGVALWAMGLFFESVGDYQLARFKADPANHHSVMNRGLWRYTRHPNYFGDFLVWWGLFVTAGEAASWWWTFLAPLLMSFLLVQVSGVRLLEKSLRRRVDGYEEYLRSTNAFFPGPPRKNGPPT